MSRARALLHRLREDTRGATLVEFGFVSVPLCLLLLAITDLGYQSYLGKVAEGTLQQAARLATVGNKNATQIDAFVKGKLQAFSHKATITIDKKSYYQFSGVGKPEKIKQDTAPLGQYNVGDCFEDQNNNGSYDVNAGATGLGGSDDIVYYKVTIVYPSVVPLYKFIGGDKMKTVTVDTVLRNQPFASQTVPKVIC